MNLLGDRVLHQLNRHLPDQIVTLVPNGATAQLGEHRAKLVMIFRQLGDDVVGVAVRCGCSHTNLGSRWRTVGYLLSGRPPHLRYPSESGGKRSEVGARARDLPSMEFV